MQEISSSGALPDSSAVSRNGPSGVVASNVLPCSHSGVLRWKSRAEMSFATAKPAMAAAASSAVARVTRLSDHDGELGLPVHRLGAGRQDDGIVGADQGIRKFREKRGMGRQFPPHFQDVLAVVQTDTDDLSGCGDQRREVRVLQRKALPAVVLSTSGDPARSHSPTSAKGSGLRPPSTSTAAEVPPSVRMVASLMRPTPDWI